MDYEELNDKIKDWRKRTRQELIAETNKLNIKHRSNSPSKIPFQKALKATYSKELGVINKIRFKFPRHGVFVHKGVGRGDDSNRTPKEWFNPVIEPNTEELGDIVADMYGDMAVNSINIR